MVLQTMRLLLVLGLVQTAVCARCGLHGEPDPGPAEEPADLTPKRFWNEYVRKMRPVIIRGAVKNDAGMREWRSDKYMLQHYGHMKVRMEAKDEGGNRGQDHPVVDTLTNFYTKWIDQAYTVTQLPGAMNNQSTIIPCMACGPIRGHFIEANLWISNGDTNSKIHKDSNNQMNCLYVGTKEWTLFAPENGPNLYLVNERPGGDQTFETAGFSRIETRDVDLGAFPRMRKVPFMVGKVGPGDCIFVPGTYMHHVHSSGERNIQVSMLFSGRGIPTSLPRVYGKTIMSRPFAESAQYVKCEADGYNQITAPLIGQVDVAWPYDGVGPITMGFANPAHYVLAWQDSFRRYSPGTVPREKFAKYFDQFMLQNMDPCDDRTATFDVDVEAQRHVYEALDIAWPEHANNRAHWNASCEQSHFSHECKIPKLCTILHSMVRDQAYALYDKLAAESGGQMKADDFIALSRREVQDALVGPFVRDQVSSILSEVTGDYGLPDPDEDESEAEDDHDEM